MIGLQEGYLGCLLRLACGDAVGTTAEFAPRGSFPPVTGMDGGGPFDLQPGQWTDDTSMALCLAESLLERDGFDLADQLRRIAPAYRAKGIEISHLGHSREGALWRITPIRSSTATPPGVEGGIRYGAHRE